MEARKYKSDVSNRNPWKEPTSSTKKPAPTVPTIAANVPAVFEIPKTRNEVVLITYHPNYNVQRLSTFLISYQIQKQIIFCIFSCLFSRKRRYLILKSIVSYLILEVHITRRGTWDIINGKSQAVHL